MYWKRAQYGQKVKVESVGRCGVVRWTGILRTMRMADCVPVLLTRVAW